jgi:hypothetical protein
VSQVTQWIEAFPECEGCLDFKDNECGHKTADLIHCYRGEIKNPLEWYLERRSWFKLKGDKDG